MQIINSFTNFRRKAHNTFTLNRLNTRFEHIMEHSLDALSAKVKVKKPEQ